MKDELKDMTADQLEQMLAQTNGAGTMRRRGPTS